MTFFDCDRRASMHICSMSFLWSCHYCEYHHVIVAAAAVTVLLPPPMLLPLPHCCGHHRRSHCVMATTAAIIVMWPWLLQSLDCGHHHCHCCCYASVIASHLIAGPSISHIWLLTLTDPVACPATQSAEIEGPLHCSVVMWGASLMSLPFGPKRLSARIWPSFLMVSSFSLAISGWGVLSPPLPLCHHYYESSTLYCLVCIYIWHWHWRRVG